MRPFWNIILQTFFPIKAGEKVISVPHFVSPLLKENILLAGNAFIQEYTLIIKHFLLFLDFSKDTLIKEKNNLSAISYLDNQLKELFRMLQNYIKEFQMEAHLPEISSTFLSLAYILEILVYLENSLADKAKYLHTTTCFKEKKIQQLIHNILEAEEAVLLLLYDTVELRDDLEPMLVISGNKQSVIREIRSQLLSDLSQEDADALVLLTDLFAREIWLINQLCDHLKKSPDYSIQESENNH